MKKTILLLIIALTPLLGFSQNETINATVNDTFTNATMPWYQNYVDTLMSADILTLASIIVGLLIVEFLGRIAFKFIKWIIIILIIILALRIIL
ncbi:MAG: hypothetical protein JW791_05475 [Nanoarchaeota archaeon]|nr:hypothetical protein [Nanoarchaeota archaeon]